VRSLRWLAVVLAISFAVTAPLRAQAQVEQTQDEREVRARELFGFGKYAEALLIYGKLYAERAHPTYLRNMGRCYQNMGEADKAIGSFREYLRQARNLAPNERAIVEGYIREMEEMKARQASLAATNGAPAPRSADPTLAAPPLAAAAISGGANPSLLTATPETSADQRASDGWGTRKSIGVAFGAAALGGLATGVIFGLVYDSRASAFNAAGCATSSSNDGPAGCQGRRNSAQSAEELFITGYVSAAVFGGLGAYLFFAAPAEAKTSVGSRSRSFSLRCLPSIAAGVTCGGRF
jgi:tetratricopeptide (TPR) repeat protein